MAETSAPVSVRAEGYSLRAVAALLLAVGVPWILISFAAEIDRGLASLLGRGESAGSWLDLAIALLILLLAIASSLLLRQPIRIGSDGRGFAIGALPVGIVAPAVALGLATAAGATAFFDGKVASFTVFLVGSLLIIIKALGEEMLFRGLLQPLLCRAWGVPVGITLASLAFTAIHIAGGWSDPISLLNITLAGMWFGLLAWRTGGILAPTLAHAGYNWAEEILFGASPNPGIGNFGALMNIDLTGPMRLGGSADGLNASLLLTAVLMAIILPLLTRPSIGKAAAARQETGPRS